MKSAYQIIRRPVITEKGLAIKENQNTLVFQVAPKATKTEIKQAVQTIFKVKVFSVRTATYPGKERRRGKFAGLRPVRNDTREIYGNQDISTYYADAAVPHDDRQRRYYDTASA